MQEAHNKLIKDFLPLIGSPAFEPDTTPFGSIDHPVVITGRDNDICRQCGETAQCKAAAEIYIPSLGRFIYGSPYNGDIDQVILLLSSLAGMLRDYRAFTQQSENFAFYKQLVKKVVDLNPHAVSVLDSDGKLILQNIIAKNESWPAEYKMTADTFPVFMGAKTLGQVQLIRSQSFNVKSVAFADTDRKTAFHNILGTDPAITNCIDVARQVSPTNSTILILGESGTGKEIFARAIHKGSHRKNKTFVAVNCAAIPGNLLESELFGYVEGAFTGAKRGGKTGKIAAADKGTLFLDEIGDMPLPLQAKLLRVLQDKKVEPIGSLKSKDVDLRIICATNKNIEALISEKQFREDLYYRINVIPIHIPPLRAHKKDIPLLLDYNIRKYCILADKSFKPMDTGLSQRLVGYEWRGNVRELENVVEYAVAMCDADAISFNHLPVYLKRVLSSKTAADDNSAAQVPPKASALHRHVAKKPMIINDTTLAALIDKHGFNTEGKKRIAGELNISLATLYRRIKKMTETEAQT